MKISKPYWNNLKKWALVNCSNTEYIFPNYILCQQPLLEKLQEYLTTFQEKHPNIAMTAEIVLYISAKDLDEAKQALVNLSVALVFTEKGFSK